MMMAMTLHLPLPWVLGSSSSAIRTFEVPVGPACRVLLAHCDAQHAVNDCGDCLPNFLCDRSVDVSITDCVTWGL